jgi:ABC-type transport system involved in cytochrome c biogenesis permease subunit
MDSETMAAIAAAACFLVAALAFSRSEEAGIWLGAAGVAFLAGSLIAHGWGARQWPLNTSYEFTLVFALGTAVSGVLLGRRKEQLGPAPQTPTVRAAAMALTAALLVYARLGMPAASHTIHSSLPEQTLIWQKLHVSTAALGYGALALAGLAGLVWLVQKPTRKAISKPDPQAPTGTAIEQDAQWLLDQAILAGYPLLTLSLVLGALESWTAGGRPWIWDIRRISTLFLWLVYTPYWPLRKRTRWNDRQAAWWSLIGLGCLMFTFLGAGLLVRWTGLES